MEFKSSPYFSLQCGFTKKQTKEGCKRANYEGSGVLYYLFLLPCGSFKVLFRVAFIDHRKNDILRAFHETKKLFLFLKIPGLRLVIG